MKTINKFILIVLLNLTAHSLLHASNGISISVIEGELSPAEAVNTLQLPPPQPGKVEKPALSEKPVDLRSSDLTDTVTEQPLTEESERHGKRQIAEQDAVQKKEQPRKPPRETKKPEPTKKPGTLVGVEAQHRPDIPDRPTIPGRPERPEQPERPERPEKPERPDIPDRPELPRKPERPGK